MKMQINWIYSEDVSCKLKTFFKKQGISRRLLAKVRYSDGKILINGKSGRKIDKIKKNDKITLVVPDEEFRRNVPPSFVPIKILYEDDNYLLVDKPAFVASIPSPLHPNDSLVNRVVGYYQIRGYRGIIPHIVTRLDRDTSGIVIFAKHRYAHALLDSQLKEHKISKTYTAILSGILHNNHYIIDLPIGRDSTSLIKRKVLFSEKAKRSKTEIFVKERIRDNTLCKIKLHTGRTHQIRVHCSYLGYPLVSDTLYGGVISMPLQRQALHCSEVVFWDQFSSQYIKVKSNIFQDMMNYLK